MAFFLIFGISRIIVIYNVIKSVNLTLGLHIDLLKELLRELILWLVDDFSYFWFILVI